LVDVVKPLGDLFFQVGRIFKKRSNNGDMVGCPHRISLKKELFFQIA